MNKEAILQETYDLAFNDELAKIAEIDLRSALATVVVGGSLAGLVAGSKIKAVKRFFRK